MSLVLYAMKKPTWTIVKCLFLLVAFTFACDDQTKIISEEIEAEPEDLAYLEEDVDSIVNVSVVDFQDTTTYSIEGNTVTYITPSGGAGYEFNQSNEISFCGEGSSFLVIDSLPPLWQDGMTISVRVAFDDVRSFSRIIDFGNDKGQDGGYNIVLARLAETDDVVFSHWTNSSTADVEGVVAEDVIDLGKFFYIGVTASSSGLLKIYINGKLANTQEGQPIVNIGRGKNFVGRSHWCGRDPDFKGKIEDIMIFNSELTGPQVKALHKRDI